MTPEDRLRAELENNVRIFLPRGGGQGTAGGGEDEQPASAHEPISGINWAELEGREPPRREFIVENWLPTGVATSLYAPGGFGKTLLAKLLASCAATGKPFLGLPTKQVPVLALFCEDDDDELWRRQHRINGMLLLRMTDLGGFTAQGRLGMSNLIMTFPKGQPPDPLPLLAEIEAKASAIGAKACHPSVQPGTPQRWRWYQALQARLKATDATLEERGQAAQQVARLRGRGFFSSGVARWTMSHIPVETAQNSASAMTRMSRAMRSGRSRWLSSRPKPRVLKSASIASMPHRRPWSKARCTLGASDKAMIQGSGWLGS
jgi:hypothetical protein